MSTEDNKKSFYKYLIIAQKICAELVLKKNQKGYGYNYSDLNATLDVINAGLKDVPLGYTQYIKSNENGNHILITELYDDTGFVKEHNYPIVNCIIKGANEAQSFGASVSYAKRYALQAIFGLASEDNDASSQKSHSEPQPKYSKSFSPFCELLKKCNTQEELEEIKLKLREGKAQLFDFEIKKLGALCVEAENRIKNY